MSPHDDDDDDENNHNGGGDGGCCAFEDANGSGQWLTDKVVVLILRTLHWCDVLRVEAVSRRTLRIARTLFWPSVRRIQHNAGLLDPRRLAPAEGGGANVCSWILDRSKRRKRDQTRKAISDKRRCLTTRLLSRLFERSSSSSAAEWQLQELNMRSAMVYKWAQFERDGCRQCNPCCFLEDDFVSLPDRVVSGAGIGRLLERHPAAFACLQHIDLSGIRLTSAGRELSQLADCAGSTLISIILTGAQGSSNDASRHSRECRSQEQIDADALELRANIRALIGACRRLKHLTLSFFDCAELVSTADVEPALLMGLCANNGVRTLNTRGVMLGGPDVALIGERCGASLEELSINLYSHLRPEEGHSVRVSHINTLLRSFSKVLEMSAFGRLDPKLEGVRGANQWDVHPIRRTLQKLTLYDKGAHFEKLIPGPGPWYDQLVELNFNLTSHHYNAIGYNKPCYVAIGTISARLRRLRFNTCDDLEGVDLVNIARQQSNLEALTVTWCHLVNDRALGEVLCLCKRLFVLKSGKQMTDWLLAHVERVLVERRRSASDDDTEAEAGRPISIQDPNIFYFLRHHSANDLHKMRYGCGGPNPDPKSPSVDCVFAAAANGR